MLWCTITFSPLIPIILSQMCHWKRMAKWGALGMWELSWLCRNTFLIHAEIGIQGGPFGMWELSWLCGNSFLIHAEIGIQGRCHAEIGIQGRWILAYRLGRWILANHSWENKVPGFPLFFSQSWLLVSDINYGNIRDSHMAILIFVDMKNE
jgi:hypothetical protein